MADRSTDRILFSLETLGLSASPRNEMCKKFRICDLLGSREEAVEE